MDWGQFRVSWGGFGAVLVQFRVALGQFGADWVQFAAIGGCLGSDLGPSGTVCCPFMALSHLLRPLFLHFSPPNPLFPQNRPFSPPNHSAGTQLVFVPSQRDAHHDFVYPQPPFVCPDLPKEDKAVPKLPPKNSFFSQSDPSLPRVTWGADLGLFAVGLGLDLGSLRWTWGRMGSL